MRTTNVTVAGVEARKAAVRRQAEAQLALNTGGHKRRTDAHNATALGSGGGKARNPNVDPVPCIVCGGAVVPACGRILAGGGRLQVACWPCYNTAVADRPCLWCGKEFKSRGPHHRQCSACRKHAAEVMSPPGIHTSAARCDEAAA